MTIPLVSSALGCSCAAAVPVLSWTPQWWLWLGSLGLAWNLLLHWGLVILTTGPGPDPDTDLPSSILIPYLGQEKITQFLPLTWSDTCNYYCYVIAVASRLLTVLKLVSKKKKNFTNSLPLGQKIRTEWLQPVGQGIFSGGGAPKYFVQLYYVV